MRDLAKDFNLNPVERGDGDTKAAVKDLKAELTQMMPITKGTPPEEIAKLLADANNQDT